MKTTAIDAAGHSEALGASPLAPIASLLLAGRPASVQVRTLLAWYGFPRRTGAAIDQIAQSLERHGLRTSPDFADAWIDEEIDVCPTTPPEPGLSSSGDQTTPDACPTGDAPPANSTPPPAGDTQYLREPDAPCLELKPREAFQDPVHPYHRIDVDALGGIEAEDREQLDRGHVRSEEVRDLLGEPEVGTGPTHAGRSVDRVTVNVQLVGYAAVGGVFGRVPVSPEAPSMGLHRTRRRLNDL